MGEQISDRYNPSRQLKVNADGSVDTNLVSEGLVVSSANPLPVTVNEVPPTDPSKTNGSLVLAYDLDNNLSTITKTIGATSYRKTLTYTTGSLTGVSSWVEV